MKDAVRTRCAIYTRKSSEEGLEQSFNSLHAQREACEAYVLSQRHEGWQPLSAMYDDGGFSGGSMERPALKRLLEDIAAKRIDTVVVYKVDRLTRSLADFAKIVEQFDKQGISFVSVTQQFNTTTSMGRLTLNVLLSFAQFEREVTGERIRDKIAASKRKGMWMGGVVPLGYDLRNRSLLVNEVEAATVREIYSQYLRLGCVSKLQTHLARQRIVSKRRVSASGRASGGSAFSRGALYEMLRNRIYLGEITHKEASYPGQHPRILDQKLWDQVQAKLTDNLQAKRRTPRSSEHSLLTGLLFDSEGNRFTPTHATKRGRRYRYYTSQAVIGSEKPSSDGPTRLPAALIEQAVLDELTQFFQSPQRLMAALVHDCDPGEMLVAAEAIRRLDADSTELANQLLKNALMRVVIFAGRLELILDVAGVRGAISGETKHLEARPGAERELRLEAPICFKISRGVLRVALAPGSDAVKGRPEPVLIKAIARAHDWVEKILRGEAANQRDLSEMVGLDERYVSRILPLAFLAPDLAERILEGSAPPSLTLERLVSVADSSCWREQQIRCS